MLEELGLPILHLDSNAGDWEKLSLHPTAPKYPFDFMLCSVLKAVLSS